MYSLKTIATREMLSSKFLPQSLTFLPEVEIPEFDLFYLCMIQPWNWVFGYCDPKILSYQQSPWGYISKPMKKGHLQSILLADPNLVSFLEIGRQKSGLKRANLPSRS